MKSSETGRGSRRRICLLTNWYPSEQNPYFGLFFREQALALSDRSDFLVVHYTERVRKAPWQKDRVIPVRQEGNIAEYTIEARVPAGTVILDALAEKLIRRLRGEKDAAFPERSARREKIKARKLIRIFEAHFRDQADAFYCVDAQREAADVQRLARHFGKPYVVGEHGPVPWPGTVIPEPQKRAVAEADAFLAISRDKIRQLMMQDIRLPRTVYIGNLVDESRFTLREAAERGSRTLLAVGAHSFYKNYDLMIRVLNRLTDITEVPFRVLIAGYGANRGYSRNAAELEEKIRGSAFADRAELIPAVPHERMAELYHRADAFLMTSVQEGQPVSALEAACCGLPVFSTRCGGVEDYVEEETGRIYEIPDAEGMAEGLKAYLEGRITFDPAKIREKTVARFGREAFGKHFAEAFGPLREE